jgi:hypothetical protein
MKLLAARDPIGAMVYGMVDAGHVGSISNPIATTVLTILKIVPFGLAVKVDKRFFIENEYALLGIGCVRIMKLMEKQSQQSLMGTTLIQKIGKTRIVIEKNGQMKQATTFFDARNQMNQIGLAGAIFRSSFLLAQTLQVAIYSRETE